MSTNRVVRLVSRPQGTVAKTDLKLFQEDIPKIKDGEVLLQNLWASIDPTHRIWMSDKAQYMDPVNIGDVMRATTIALVVESKNEDYDVGDKVVSFGGICDYVVGTKANIAYKCNQDKIPVTAELSVASIIVGLAAYHGCRKILNPGPQDIVCVSGAAGAVGSLVGQIAKLAGAKVIGIAGSDDKCEWMKEDLGFDCVINYKTQDVSAAIKAFAPDGVSRYFDNVGGKVTDDVLMNMQKFSKYALCGSISEYNDQWAGQKNFNMILMRRISVTGFICIDHLDELEEMREFMVSNVLAGKIKYNEDIREGMEKYVDTLNLLSSGHNTGKLILKLNEAMVPEEKF